MALCHEWLNDRHGSEKTFERIAQTFPYADLYALSVNPSVPFALGDRKVATTFIDRLGPLRQRRDLQLPLMPLAWRYATRRRYDVVVTSSHACAKAFWPARRALHLCYCYTPLRYVWHTSVDQRGSRNRLAGFAEKPLRTWDRRSAQWVDEFAAISVEVKARIERVYSRPARVIHPPVDTDFYSPGDTRHRQDFALAVSRMVGYKRLDLAIEACHMADCPLVVAGAGPQESALRALAAELGARVEFVILPSDEKLRELYRAARLLIFPAEEDFGIVPVEAQACGTPVVAFGGGGSVDTVVDGITGTLVAVQSREDFAKGLRFALEAGFDPVRCRQNAERFSVTAFQSKIIDWVGGAARDRGIDLVLSR